MTGALVCYFLTRKRLSKELSAQIEDFVPFMVLGGLIGARFAYVLISPGTWNRPETWLAFWEGGMVSYGGLIGGLIGLLCTLKYKNQPILLFLDAFAPPALIGWGIGRLGCLLSWYGEHGTKTSVPWAFLVDGEARHPIMLYLSLSLIACGLILLMLPKREATGQTAGLALALYGVVRAILETWRDYDPPELSLASQSVCAILVLIGLGLAKNVNPGKRNRARLQKDSLGDVKVG